MIIRDRADELQTESQQYSNLDQLIINDLRIMRPIMRRLLGAHCKLGNKNQ